VQIYHLFAHKDLSLLQVLDQAKLLALVVVESFEEKL